MDQTYKIKIRLFCKSHLEIDGVITLNIQDTHYLKSVMRCKVNNIIYLFNNLDGEYESRIISLEKKHFVLKIIKKSKRSERKFDLHLIFTPIKRDKTEYIIQKATELGVSEIFPIITDRTIVRKLNYDRLYLIAKEASELSERISIPKINSLKVLKDVINDWDCNRIILYADETMKERINIELTMKKLKSTKGAILIGPEGGFSQSEISFLKSKKFVLPISLGERILRADTAAIVGLSYWHFINSKNF